MGPAYALAAKKAIPAIQMALDKGLPCFAFTNLMFTLYFSLLPSPPSPMWWPGGKGNAAGGPNPLGLTLTAYPPHTSRLPENNGQGDRPETSTIRGHSTTHGHRILPWEATARVGQNRPKPVSLNAFPARGV